MKKLPLLLLLGACVDEDTRVYATWVGVYRVDAYHVDDETCGPGGPEADPPASHLLIDARVFAEDALVRATRCASAESCTDGTHFEVVTTSPTPERLAGSGGAFRFFPISSQEGVCQAHNARVELVRDGDAVSMTVQRLDRRDVRVESEEDCLALVEELTDADCHLFEAFELSQVL